MAPILDLYSKLKMVGSMPARFQKAIIRGLAIVDSFVEIFLDDLLNPFQTLDLLL